AFEFHYWRRGDTSPGEAKRSRTLGVTAGDQKSVGADINRARRSDGAVELQRAAARLDRAAVSESATAVSTEEQIASVNGLHRSLVDQAVGGIRIHNQRQSRDVRGNDATGLIDDANLVSSETAHVARLAFY